MPTILCENTDEYKETVERYHTFAERVHIDVTDGEFAPTFTVGVNQIWWPEEWKVDIHAMVTRPSQYVDALIQMKPTMIIFHSEASEDLLPVIQKVKSVGIRAGIALLKTTVPSTMENYIKEADHVLVFSGELGQYGGVASLMQLEKIRLIHNINPSVEIGWDGGANLENAYNLSQGGADIINCGKVISSADDPGEVYKQLVAQVNKHGVI